jgi:hypothetical protein
MTEQMARLTRRNKRDRRLSFVLALSVLLDVGLSVATVRLYTDNHNVSQAEHRSAITACHLANKNRVENITINAELMKATGLEGTTAAASITHLIAEVNALRDCSKLYSTS